MAFLIQSGNVSVPLYEYQCKPNGHRFEVRQGIHEEPVRVCSECGGDVRRVVQRVGIVFKGAGFYATDSRTTKSAVKPAESANKATGESAPSDSKSETKSDSKADSKTESKPASKSEPAAS